MIITNWWAFGLGVFVLLLVGGCVGIVLASMCQAASCGDCQARQAETNLRLRREINELRRGEGVAE